MIKVDKIEIDKTVLGYQVKAINIINGKETQVGDIAILSSEFEAMLFARYNYEMNNK